MKDVLDIHTDGGSRGNPGPAACAFVVEDHGKVIYKNSKFLGKGTNNFAEYQGLIMALNWIGNNRYDFLDRKIIFFLDSELVVKQMKGLYRVKDENIRNLFMEVNGLIKEFPGEIVFENIPRSKNKTADLLVNEELDKNR